jgi:hypothetical protein
MRRLIEAASLNELAPSSMRGEFSKVSGTWADDEPDIWAQILTKVVPGISVLGTGANAIALDLPGGQFVLKAWKNDPSYETFVSFCQKYSGAGKEHLPRFVPPASLRKLRKGINEDMVGSARLGPTSRFRFAIVERLSPIPHGTMLTEWLPESAYMAMVGGLYPIEANEMFRTLAEDPRTAKIIASAGIKNHRDLTKPSNRRLIEEALGSIPAGWKRVINALNRTRDSIGATWDLHDQNIMLRGNTLVISDPFYTSSSD